MDSRLKQAGMTNNFKKSKIQNQISKIEITIPHPDQYHKPPSFHQARV